MHASMWFQLAGDAAAIQQECPGLTVTPFGRLIMNLGTPKGLFRLKIGFETEGLIAFLDSPCD